MNLSEYAKALEIELGPRLQKLGFAAVRLRDCMCPEALYRHQELWLGTTWDGRDRHLEVSLGGLFWAKDVMPRVVVVGQYARYCPEFSSLDLAVKEPGQVIAAFLARTIGDAVAARQAHPEIEIAERARLAHLLVGQVTDAQLSAFVA